MAEDIRVGLVGYGAAGRVFHAPVIDSVQGLVLAKVVERRTKESPRRYPRVQVVTSAEELLRDPELDLVVIATPNASHFDLAREALLAGKHVVVDKPVTTSAARARALVELARERERLLTVFQNRRWDGDFLTVKQIVSSGLLGRLVAFESRFDRYRDAPKPNAWRERAGEGSGVLFDIGSHLIDQALVLFGLPAMITADIRIEREFATTDDSFDLLLHYDGLKVTLGASMLVREPGPRFALHGTLGSFVKHGLDPQEAALKAGRSPSEAEWALEPQERWGVIDTEIAGLHVRGRIETLAGSYPSFYENVRDAVRGGQLAVRAEEAVDTLRIIELAIQSHAERRSVPVSRTVGEGESR